MMRLFLIITACLLLPAGAFPAWQVPAQNGIIARAPGPIGPTENLLRPGGLSGNRQRTAPQPYTRPTFENFPLNIAVFRAINDRRHPVLDYLAIGLIFLGSGWILVPLLPVIVWRRRRKALILLGGVVIQLVVVYLLKTSLEQPRPTLLLADVHLLQDLSFKSFPSGDVTFTMVIAMVVAFREGRLLRILPFVYVLIIALERIYVGVHFPLDVAAGAALGMAIGYGCCRLPDAMMHSCEHTQNLAGHRDAHV